MIIFLFNLSGDTKNMKIRWLNGNDPIHEFTRGDAFKYIEHKFRSPGYKFLTVQVKNPFTALMSSHLWVDLTSKINGIKVFYLQTNPSFYSVE